MDFTVDNFVSLRGKYLFRPLEHNEEITQEFFRKLYPSIITDITVSGFVCVRVRARTRMYLYVCLCMCTCVCVCVHLCACACACVHICILEQLHVGILCMHQTYYQILLY